MTDVSGRLAWVKEVLTGACHGILKAAGFTKQKP